MKGIPQTFHSFSSDDAIATMKAINFKRALFDEDLSLNSGEIIAFSP
jgi:hypothetical protein